MMLRLAVLALALTLTSTSFQGEWAVFKHKHNKSYGVKEELYRQSVFQETLKLIERHNDRFASGDVSYYLGINQFSDWTKDEFKSYTKCLQLPKIRPQPTSNVKIDVSKLPRSFDWRHYGVVTGVKDQGQCRSCWAFSTIGALESAHAMNTSKLVSLSESNLVDCTTETDGCDGGWMSLAFQYIIDNKGIDTEESYPYHPEDEDCKFSPRTVGATMSAYVNVTFGSEAALQEAVAKYGPISVAIDDGESFQLYGGGILDDPSCKSDIEDLDHAVLVVGYGSDNGEDYWIVKNSWGDWWGESGYIRMSRNKNNQCGIATFASYPII